MAGRVVTGAEVFDDLCRKAGLPTEAEHLAAIHSSQIEELLGRYEGDKAAEAESAKFWNSITIRKP